MRKFVFIHPIVFKGEQGIEAVPGIPINASSPLTASFKAVQDISLSGNLRFNQLNSTNVNVSNGKFIIQKEGSEVEFVPSGAFDVTGSVTTNNNLTVPGNFTIGGLLKAKDIQTQLQSASTIFPSGSTKFGDDTGDKHQFTGSLSVGTQTTMSITIPKVSGVPGPITYDIAEFRNIPFPSAPYNQTQPVTEYAGANLVAPFSANQRYIRRSFAKKATSLTSTTVIFNAETASAPRSDDASLFEQLPATSKDDFMFFRNGMVMEQDALSINQNGSEFVVTIKPDDIGYELTVTDEIIAWGKFNS